VHRIGRSRSGRGRRSSSTTPPPRPRRYEYPRWFFTDSSTDILGLRNGALERLGIAHHIAAPTRSPVARREAMAALDAAIGPKAGTP
jgi:hypothetical protein